MRKHLLFVAAVAISVVSFGCAITDYDGFADHQTAAEAKLWGTEIAFSGTGDPELDGTYSYTVRYDNRGGQGDVTITTYRNPVVGSFSRDGLVDRDGDDIQGRSGILGGRFQTRYVAIDTLHPTCEFFANITQSKGPDAQIALCATTNEEVDKDLDLQASFGSMDDLLGQIWSGAITGGFTMEVTGVRLNGVQVALGDAFSIGAKSNGIRPMQFSIDMSQPGAAGLIQAILNNTQDGMPAAVGFDFAGGMSVDLPSHWKIAFNHEGLFGLL